MIPDRLDLSRPRSLGELLACTFSLQRRWFSVFFSVTAVVNVPVILLVDGMWNRQLADGASAQGPPAAQVASVALSAIVVPGLVTALHVRIVQGLSAGEEPQVGGAFRAIRTAAGPALGATALFAIATAIGLFALVLPGIYLLVRLYFAPQFAVVDGRRGSAALTASGELVRGRWPLVAGNLLAMAVIGFLIAAVPAQLFAHADNAGFAYIVIQAVLGTIVVSLGALFGTLLFFSLRATPAPPV